MCVCVLGGCLKSGRTGVACGELQAFIFGVVFLEFEGVLVFWEIVSREALGCGFNLFDSRSFVGFGAGWVEPFPHQRGDLPAVLALHPRGKLSGEIIKGKQMRNRKSKREKQQRRPRDDILT